MNFTQRTHPILLIGLKTLVFVCFVLFGYIWDCLFALLGAKWAELVKKFVPRSRVRIFATNTIDPPPLDPKLMFLCVSYYLGAFGTVWLPYRTRRKTVRPSATVRATKSRRIFLQRMVPIHLIGH